MPTSSGRRPRRSQRHVDGSEADDLADAADALADAIAGRRPAGSTPFPSSSPTPWPWCATRPARAAVGVSARSSDEADAGLTQAKGSVQEVFVNAERMAGRPRVRRAVAGRGAERLPPKLCVAPLEVWGEMRDKLLSDKTAVFTSATLMLGGDFSALATSVGLASRPSGWSTRAGGPSSTTTPSRGGVSTSGRRSTTASRRSSYVARHLPPPGRDGLGEAQLREIAELVDAAGGRTLGLFSSRRAAETAAEAVREQLPDLTMLAQGDAQLPELAKQFVSDPHTCLFGTLSLWQGLDVPGETCQLVIIDRIPFPRPDDPLMSARQRAVERPAATASCRSRPPTPRCSWPRGRAG